MEKFNTILEELREIAPTISVLGKPNPYQLPDFYFDLLASEILNKINSVNIMGSQNPYNTPAGYFDGLANSILKKIHGQKVLKTNNEAYAELLEIAPLLSTLKKENVYSAPADYFENLRSPKIFEKPAAKIIPIGSRIRKWVTYTAAASILFIVSTASYFYANKHIRGIDKSPSIEQRLADLNEDDIINYLNDNQETSNDYIPASGTQETEIQEMLEKASDDELKSFLDENDSDKKLIKGI